MSKIVEEVVVSEEEIRDLESSWYRYQSLLELIKGGVTDDIVMANYTNAYIIKFKLNKKYLSKDYSNMGPSYNQAADFVSRKITITKD